MDKTTIVLADDHALVRAGLRKLLESIPDLAVVGEAGDGRTLVGLVETLQPDIALVDITMPQLNGLDATLELARKCLRTRVIILSMYENEEYVSQAMVNGAKGYLLKDAAPNELHIAILTVMAGRPYLSPTLQTDSLNNNISELAIQRKAAPSLSPRQMEIVALIARGNSNKEIARLLNLSTKTVETHRSRVMQQLDIHEVTGLVHYAIRTGII